MSEKEYSKATPRSEPPVAQTTESPYTAPVQAALDALTPVVDSLTTVLTDISDYDEARTDIAAAGADVAAAQRRLTNAIATLAKNDVPVA